MRWSLCVSLMLIVYCLLMILCCFFSLELCGFVFVLLSVLLFKLLKWILHINLITKINRVYTKQSFISSDKGILTFLHHFYKNISVNLEFIIARNQGVWLPKQIFFTEIKNGLLTHFQTIPYIRLCELRS